MQTWADHNVDTAFFIGSPHVRRSFSSGFIPITSVVQYVAHCCTDFIVQSGVYGETIDLADAGVPASAIPDLVNHKFFSS